MSGLVRRRGAYDQSRVEQRPIDTRKFLPRLIANMDNPDGLMLVMFFTIGVIIIATIVPMVGGVLFFPIYLLFRKYMHPRLRLHNFPFRVPAHLKVPDGSKKDFAEKGAVLENLNMFKPEGKQFWGVSKENRLQVWASIADLKTHMTILGGTGSGKTELLYTMTTNQLIQDSGFIYADAKGDIALEARIQEQLRRFDRHEDLLVISFAAGNRDLSAAHRERITNTFNIMSSNSDSMLIEIISGMVSSSETGADMWEGRCLAFVAALTRPLVFLRDRGLIDLAPQVYMENMELVVVEELVFGEHPEEAKGIDKTLEALKGFLISLPGYSQSKRGKQDQKTNEQFGFIAMQLTRVFSDLGYNYGHIFDAKVGEIDVSDVVLNRRCLNILLPSLERSSSTLTMLGKLIMGSVKQMMAGSLGASVEGVMRLNVEARPTNATNVFRVILDEVGYIMVPGMSITTAQARSLNISMTFAAQTFSDLKRGNALEADGIWDNTSLKLIGRLMGGEETTSETWQKVLGMAGHVQEAVVSGYNKKTGAFGVNYQTSEHISVQRTARIELEYLRSLQDGEFVLFGAKKIDGGVEGENMIVPMNVMFAKSEIKPVEMRINDLIPVSKAGSRLDDSQAKNSLKEFLSQGTLHAQFQSMAYEEPAGSASQKYASLALFEELGRLTVDETQHNNLGLAVTFYKNLYEHVAHKATDDGGSENALKSNNVISKAEQLEETLNEPTYSATQVTQQMFLNSELSDKKHLFSEEDEARYSGHLYEVSDVDIGDNVTQGAVVDSLHESPIYQNRTQRTKDLSNFAKNPNKNNDDNLQ